MFFKFKARPPSQCSRGNQKLCFNFEFLLSFIYSGTQANRHHFNRNTNTKTNNIKIFLLSKQFSTPYWKVKKLSPSAYTSWTWLRFYKLVFHTHRNTTTRTFLIELGLFETVFELVVMLVIKIVFFLSHSFASVIRAGTAASCNILLAYTWGFTASNLRAFFVCLSSVFSFIELSFSGCRNARWRPFSCATWSSAVWWLSSLMKSTLKVHLVVLPSVSSPCSIRFHFFQGVKKLKNWTFPVFFSFDYLKCCL